MRHALLEIATRASLLAVMVLPSVYASEGLVGYDLQMGGPTHQSYAYIFSGIVTRGGKTCAHVQVEADLNGAHDQSAVETVETDDQGHYLLKVVVEALPQEETTWKLIAKAAGLASEPIEVEGRTILMDDTTVVIDRALQMGETGA